MMLSFNASVEDTSRTFFCDIIIYDVILIVYKHAIEHCSVSPEFDINVLQQNINRSLVVSFPGLDFVEGSSSTVGVVGRMSKEDDKGA